MLPMELLQSLLRAAGIYHHVDSISHLGTSTNAVWQIKVGTQKYVMRHRQDGDEGLAIKEVFISELLRKHQVPTTEILATATSENGVATLCTWVPGLRLDHAIQQLSATDQYSAWHSCGAVLRLVHEIGLPHAGEIIGEEIKPFTQGWGTWVLEDVAEDIRWLQETLSLPHVDESLLERTIGAAISVLADVPTQLLHNDALPQNILVSPGPNGWVCTGWLDWEFARSGDPLWDVATLDFRPAGLVPSAFYAGYGQKPEEPAISIYELLMATWRTRAELEHGSHWDWPPQKNRLAYLSNLPAQVEALADRLAVR